MAEQAALQRELDTYRAKFDELKSSEGKFVLIHEEEIGGIFDSYADALRIGYEKYHLDQFLVKKIASVEIAQFITRHVIPCHA